MEIGFISSCIGCDSRYTSQVRVDLMIDKTFLVQRIESSPIGGMDGNETPRTVTTFQKTLKPKTGAKIQDTAKALIALIKESFDDVIIRYGAPSKKFTWRNDREFVKGLSVKTVSQVLELYEDD